MDLARAPMAPAAAAAAAPAPSSPQFPAGLRVLVVDDDLICLKILEKMLRRCLYEATTCSRAAVALSMLRERRGAFDLVLSDVYMPDMDGFKLLEHIGLEMDLPVIMMSADDGKDVVMKGVTHGACDYLIKPVRIEALKNIWQHVVRKKRNELREVENSGSMDESDKQKRMMDDVDNASSVNEGSWKNVKRRKDGKDDDDDVDDHEDSSTLKKPRVVWSVELHQQFVTAVNQLGVEKAVPKKILDLMNVPGLTRENVASHLQKYRLYLRRVSLPQHQGRYDGSFTGATDGSFGSSSSLDGFDLQALAFSGQLPAQSLISMHAGSRRVTNTPTGMPAADQISFLNSEAQIANSTRVRSSPGQLLNNKQLNFLSGMPANIESTQLGLSHPPGLSYGNISLQVTEGMSGFINLPCSLRTPSPFSGETISGHLGNAFAVQVSQQGQQFSVPQQQNHIPVDMPGQSQLRGQLRNGFKGEQNSVFLPTMEPQILSNEVSDNIPGKGGIAMNGKSIATSYGAAPQVQFAAFQNNNIIESTRSCFPPASTMRASNYTSTGMLQEDIHAMGNVEPFSNSTTLKGVKDFVPNYNLLGEPPMNKNQDWRLQNANFPYESSQHLASKQSNIDFRSSSSLHKDFNATMKDGRRNPPAITKLRTELEQNGVHIAPSKQAYLVENSVRVKAETVTDPRHQDITYDDHIMHNELMGIIGTQQGVGEGETEFNFDGYPLDDIPV